MTQASASFLTQLGTLAERIQPRITARLQASSGATSLPTVLDAVETATGRQWNRQEFTEAYARTVTCGAAVLACSGTRLAAPTIRQWLTGQAHPLWPRILDDCFTLLSEAWEPKAGEWPPENGPRIWDIAQPATRLDDDRQTVDDEYFFERFLELHDVDGRSKHGVYYTPRPLAAYIVRQVDQLLVDEFHLLDGLADVSSWRDMAEHWPQLGLPPGAAAEAPFATILDPALGTGVFLVEIIDSIFSRLTRQWSAAAADVHEMHRRWNAYVPQRLLPRMFGFELMVPACVLTILRVTAKLAETGFTFATPGTIQIQLANTLAGPVQPHGLFAGETSELAEVIRTQQRVCYRQPFTVVVGNPPFSGISQDSGRWMIDLLKGRGPTGKRVASYYEVDGQPLGERKHWLQDDYVKFFRYAHATIASAGCGVIGFVTNHGYLDNPTFRGMRQQLMRDFPRITVIDLHGNRKKKERTPEGHADENIFGIDTGVAMGFLRRPPMASEFSQVWHGELWGRAQQKLARLSAAVEAADANAAPLLATSQLTPQSPLYLFVARDETRLAEYERGERLSDLMPVNVTAPVTARDHFVIAFDRTELLGRLQQFRDLTISDDEIRQRYFRRTRSAKYQAGDTRGWSLTQARHRTAADPIWAEHVRPCWYRPFDQRPIYWADGMIDWPRSEVTDHLLAGPNLALIARRQMLPAQPCNYFWITDTLAIDGLIRSDNRGSESIFPLYLYDRGSTGKRCRANFSPAFVAAARQRLQMQWLPTGSGDLRTNFGPEDLLYYCYAQFFSPTYRMRYAALLRCDFPRVFLPADVPLFREWCRLGRQLAERHLLRSTAAVPDVQFRQASGAAGSAIVGPGYPKYADNRVWLNQQAWFESVPQQVWEYHVGGHQVCRKWWHDRRGRDWGPEEIACYARIVAALQDTLRLVQEIDLAVDEHGGWQAALSLP